jgi:chromosome segregation ATPase
MAIQNKKAPSPTELKSSPQSFTERELNDLKDLRKEISDLTLNFGQVSINLIKLEEIKKDLKKQLIDLEKKESAIAKTLSDKYGKGSINLDSGTFIPTK